jgi:hypothetical protein
MFSFQVVTNGNFQRLGALTKIPATRTHAMPVLYDHIFIHRTESNCTEVLVFIEGLCIIKVSN